jgi:hypothetical protein
VTDDVSGPAHARDVTLELRDLRRHRAGLAGADRAEADSMLSRPAAGQVTCSTAPAVCVHWSASGANRATRAYTRRVLRVADHVLATYAAAGYRAPLADGGRGGSKALDIYLQDIGHQGYYGWCDSDAPAGGTGSAGAPAYCVFDNNYREFPVHTPLENLQVTAAHELFHAVQFAYDYNEDSWFMEATATWAEDEVYTDVNDNLQYLPQSPLAQPAKSMDHFSQTGFRQYGDWIFIRYLTEHFPAAEGGLPTLVRSMWEQVSSAPGEYSMRAIREVLTARDATLPAVWADFVAANRRPGQTYAEGAANHYPIARLAGDVRLTAARRTSAATEKIDHLAGATMRWTRTSGLNARTLAVHLTLPATALGSGAVVTVKRTTGRPVSTSVELAADGTATVTEPFDGAVSWVEVSLANAGTRYRCWKGTEWSCQGRSLDDARAFEVSVRARR